MRRYEYNYDFNAAFVRFEVDTKIFTENEAESLLKFFTWEYDEDEDPINELTKKYAI